MVAAEWGARSRVCTELLTHSPTRMRKSYLKIPRAPRSFHSANRVSVTAHSIKEGRNPPNHRQLPHVMEHIPKPCAAASLRRWYGSLQSRLFLLLQSSRSTECDCDSGREFPYSEAAVHIGAPCDSKGHRRVFLTGRLAGERCISTLWRRVPGRYEGERAAC